MKRAFESLSPSRTYLPCTASNNLQNTSPPGLAHLLENGMTLESISLSNLDGLNFNVQINTVIKIVESGFVSDRDDAEAFLSWSLENRQAHLAIAALEHLKDLPDLRIDISSDNQAQTIAFALTMAAPLDGFNIAFDIDGIFTLEGGHQLAAAVRSSPHINCYRLHIINQDDCDNLEPLFDAFKTVNNMSLTAYLGSHIPAKLFEAIGANCSIKSIVFNEMDHCNFSESMDALIRILPNLNELEELDTKLYSKAQIGRFNSALEENKSIKKFELSIPSGDGINGLTHFLSNHCSAKTLVMWIDNSGFEDPVPTDDTLAQYVSSLITTNTNLETLIFKHKATSFSWPPIAEALQNNKTLRQMQTEYIAFAENDGQRLSFSQFMEGLSKNEGLISFETHFDSTENRQQIDQVLARNRRYLQDRLTPAYFQGAAEGFLHAATGTTDAGKNIAEELFADGRRDAALALVQVSKGIYGSAVARRNQADLQQLPDLIRNERSDELAWVLNTLAASETSIPPEHIAAIARSRMLHAVLMVNFGKAGFAPLVTAFCGVIGTVPLMQVLLPHLIKLDHAAGDILTAFTATPFTATTQHAAMLRQEIIEGRRGINSDDSVDDYLSKSSR